MVEIFLPERHVQIVAKPSDRNGNSELWLLRSGSHHYWDRTRPQMYKQACLCLFHPHPSQQSLVKSPGTPWVVQHFWQHLIARGSTGPEPHHLPHFPTRVLPWDWGNMVTEETPHPREYGGIFLSQGNRPHTNHRSLSRAIRENENLYFTCWGKKKTLSFSPAK